MRKLLPLGLTVLAAWLTTACAPEFTDVDARAASIEERLLASCSCHPKKIEGLPLESAIRSDIRRLLDAGQSDDQVLWAVLQVHGRALLEAGIEDIALRANASVVITALCLLASAGVMLLQLRRPGFFWG